MFSNRLDIDQNYFFMPFGPIGLKPEDQGLIYLPEENLYYMPLAGTKWRKTLLYNTGWGRPDGYERLPELPFSSLIDLALLSGTQRTKLSAFETESNKYGAIAVIMERYIKEFVEFLYSNIDNQELFGNSLFRGNLGKFCFDEKKAGTNGGDGGKSYEAILNQEKLWITISDRVKNFVYG